jgi:hypothetical protein
VHAAHASNLASHAPPCRHAPCRVLADAALWAAAPRARVCAQNTPQEPRRADHRAERLPITVESPCLQLGHYRPPAGVGWRTAWLQCRSLGWNVGTGSDHGAERKSGALEGVPGTGEQAFAGQRAAGEIHLLYGWSQGTDQGAYVASCPLQRPPEAILGPVAAACGGKRHTRPPPPFPAPQAPFVPSLGHIAHAHKSAETQLRFQRLGSQSSVTACGTLPAAGAAEQGNPTSKGCLEPLAPGRPFGLQRAATRLGGAAVRRKRGSIRGASYRATGRLRLGWLRCLGWVYTTAARVGRCLHGYNRWRRGAPACTGALARRGAAREGRGAFARLLVGSPVLQAGGPDGPPRYAAWPETAQSVHTRRRGLMLVVSSRDASPARAQGKAWQQVP